MRAISWNVNGIRAIQKKGFMDWFSSEDPDILCLQETKATKQQLSTELTSVPGYFSYFSAPERKGYSGVGLYTKQEPESVTYGFGVEKFDNEGRTIIADLGTFVLFNIYFPNGKRSEERLRFKMEFYEVFLEYINNLKSQERHIVVCGDVNTAHKEIDLARPRENSKISGFLPEERSWMDKFLADGYVDTFRSYNQDPGNYSYWDQISRARNRNVGWRIDYFFVDQVLSQRVCNAFILPEVMGSDHCPVGIEFL